MKKLLKISLLSMGAMVPAIVIPSVLVPQQSKTTNTPTQTKSTRGDWPTFEQLPLSKFDWAEDTSHQSTDNIENIVIYCWADMDAGNQLTGLNLAGYYKNDFSAIDSSTDAAYRVTRVGEYWNGVGGVGDYKSFGSEHSQLVYVTLPGTIKTIGVNEFYFLGASYGSIGLHMDWSACTQLDLGENQGLCEYVWAYSYIKEFIMPTTSTFDYIGDDDFEYGSFCCDLDFSHLTNIKTVGHWAFAQLENAGDYRITLPSSINKVTWASFCSWDLLPQIKYLAFNVKDPASIAWEVHLDFGIFTFQHLKELHIPSDGNVNAWQKQMSSFFLASCDKIVADL